MGNKKLSTIMCFSSSNIDDRCYPVGRGTAASLNRRSISMLVGTFISTARITVVSGKFKFAGY